MNTAHAARVPNLLPRLANLRQEETNVRQRTQPSLSALPL
jgi:hypothetical protein